MQGLLRSYGQKRGKHRKNIELKLLLRLFVVCFICLVWGGDQVPLFLWFLGLFSHKFYIVIGLTYGRVRKMSVEKNVKVVSLKKWLKIIKDTDYVFVCSDRVESVKTKTINIEGEKIEIRTNYICPLEIDLFFRDNETSPTAFFLSYHDKDNFYNFLVASNPDKLNVEMWGVNQSDWLKERNLAYETVVIRSKIKSKKHENFYEYNGYSCQAEKIYDVKEYRNDILKLVKTDKRYFKPISDLVFKETI